MDTEALRKLTEAERQQLLRDLVNIERESARGLGPSWKWDALLVAIAGGCIILVAWIGYLAVSLPHSYHTGSWRGAWVGFDIGLLAALASAGWAAWRRRQVLIVWLFVLSTLLICDAWFDLALDVRTAGFWASLASAIFVELPLAVIAILMARRLLHATIGQIMRYEGLSGPVPPLWRIPLLGPGDGTPLQGLMRERANRKASANAPAGPTSGIGAPPTGS